MSFYSAGAWWTDSGQAFATQAEADQFEQTQQGGADDDSFAAAMGAKPRVQAAAGAATQPGGAAAAAQRQTEFQNANAGISGTAGYGGSPEQIAAARAAARGSIQHAPTKGFGDALTDTLSIAGAAFKNPVLNPVGAAATRGGAVVDRAVGNVFDRGIDQLAHSAVSPRTNVATDFRPSVSGYIQDPAGQFLNDIGAPDLVQAAANPTGFATRTAVNADTGYGTNVPQVLRASGQAGANILNDIRNVPGTVAAGAGAVQGAANAAGGYVSGIGSAIGNAVSGGNRPTNAAAYNPAPPLPQPGMTPDQILGMQSSAVRPSSTQSDQIVQQMLGQSQQTSGYQNFSNPNYDASRNAATGYTSQLANQANNNVAITGLDAGRYDQSRGTMNQITGQLQNQANNNVGDIQANSAQRDASRASVLGTAGQLQGAAYNDVGRIDASQGQRLGAQSSMVDVENRLTNGMNSVGDIQANTGQYNAGRGDEQGTIANLIAMANQQQQIDPNLAQGRSQSNDIIARLLAAAQAQEGPSAAESLMLNAQERATRNALGNASSMGGGWRSQVTNQRSALGQAAAQQADIAAQLGALRANEASTYRGQTIDALGRAGGLAGDVSARDLQSGQQGLDYRGQSLGALGQAAGLQGDISGRDLGLAQSDAALLAQIRQGNQTNTRESQIAAGQLAGQRMNSDTALAMSDADRAMLAAQGNQDNRLNALLGAGNLQTGAMQSDTGLAQSNASLLAQIRQGNQANSLNSLIGAGNNAGNVLSSDLGFATNDANIRTQRELANQSNALQALQGAANAANQTAGLDANIGMSDADRRATVDQNNRANAINALQNAGVLSSATRGQDVQLSIADQQALTSRISSAAGLAGTTYSAQLDAALRQQDINLRQQQFQDALSRMPPAAVQQWLSAAGPVLGLLGVMV